MTLYVRMISSTIMVVCFGEYDDEDDGDAELQNVTDMTDVSV